MSAEDFRDADRIELHDSGVSLSPDNNDDGGWCEFSDHTGIHFSISGETICDIAQIFGITPSKIRKVFNGKTEYHSAEFIDFDINKKRIEVGSREESSIGGIVKIKDLSVKIIAPNLLDLRIVRYYETGEEKPS